MTIRAMQSCLVVLAFAASCAVELDKGPLVEESTALNEDDVSSSAEALTKGATGAVNGSKDYCDDPAHKCAQGEGDCDDTPQCATGLICTADKGANFGFHADYDICLPAHCSNKVLDAGLGETTADCGGPCGTCPVSCSGTAGGKDFCSGCTCASGQGDCDSNFDCAAGLVCGADNGPNFGLPAGYDVCVPSHCSDKVQNGDETGVDFGGSCGATVVPACSGTSGGKDFCVGCLCATGQGDCDGNAQCASGLVCGVDNGPNFGLPTGYDVCVPPHCSNKVRDADETGVDSGGSCGTGGGPTVPALNVYFTEYVEGTSNNHAVEIYNAGSAAQTCSVNVYFSGATTATNIPLTASLAPGAIAVLCRSGGTYTTPPCTQSSTLLTFNGDDAVELVCGGQTQDIIGQIGLDPGARWGTTPISTADNTLRRKCTVTTGDKVGNDTFVPSAQWDGFAMDTFSGLGTTGCP